MQSAQVYIKLIVFAFCFLTISCKKSEDLPNLKGQTLIVYMLANNDLYNNALADINEMESVWKDNFDGDLIVIIEPKESNGKTHIMRIVKDDDPKAISSPIIKTYEGKTGVKPEDMNFLINEVLHLYPSEKSNLILWSHATGWLPPNTVLSLSARKRANVPTKSFGEINDRQMNIQDLAVGIPNNVFDIIVFDACFMGSIEVLYEIKDKAKYIVASPAEILADGFPYKSIVPLFFSQGMDITNLGSAFFDYYNNLSGAYRSATIGVIKTSNLAELAANTKQLLNEIDPSIDLSERLNKIQYYDRYTNKIFYDFGEAVKIYYGKSNDKISSFQGVLNKTVLYSAYTPEFMNVFKINTSSGLSCYIPNKNHPVDIKKYYKNFKWYRDSGFEELFSILEQ